MSDSFETPWTVAHQATLSMGFPRQKYWSGLPFPPPGHVLITLCFFFITIGKQVDFINYRLYFLFSPTLFRT